MYKDVIQLPMDSNGKSQANWVDADGYHQSTKVQELPTFVWFFGVTTTASQVWIWDLYNTSTTSLVIVQSIRSMCYSDSNATGQQRFLSLLATGTASGGTLLGSPVALRSSYSWDTGVLLRTSPSAPTNNGNLISM